MRQLLFNFNKPGSLVRQLIHAVIGSAGVRIIGMGFTFLVGVQLARYLGPEGYGIYGTVMAVAALLTVLAQLGLPQLITREVSAYMVKKGHSRVKGMIMWSLVCVALASVVMAFVGLFGYSIWKGIAQDTAAKAFYWGVATIPLFAIANILAGILRGFHKVVLAQIFEALLRPMLFSFFLFIMASELARVGVVNALMLQTLAAFITVVILAIVMYLTLPKSVLNSQSSLHTKSWVGSAGPMAGTEILRITDGQYGILLLGLMVPLLEVGLFRVALGIVAFLGLPATIVNLVIMPYIAQFHAENKTSHLQKLATGSTALMFVSTSLMMLVVFLVGKPILAIVFGAEFVPAWPVLCVMGLAYMMSSFFGSSAAILNMSGGERSVTFAFAVGLIISLPLAYLLILKMGVIGVAWAMLVTSLLRGIMMWRKVYAIHQIDSAVTSVFKFIHVPNKSQIEKQKK